MIVSFFPFMVGVGWDSWFTMYFEHVFDQGFLPLGGEITMVTFIRIFLRAEW